MIQVRILVLSPHTYELSHKPRYYSCGEMFYLNPYSSPSDLEELGFIIDSYYKKGWVYIEDDIVNQYKSKTGLFSTFKSLSEEDNYEYVESPINLSSLPSNTIKSIEYPNVQDNKENKIVIEEQLYNIPLSPKEKREQELLELNWRDIKKIVNTYGIEYIDKELSITDILNQEFK